MRLLFPLAFVPLAGLVLPSVEAHAASGIQKECSVKYQAAKAANTLGGQTYREYYKQCAASAKAAPPAAAQPAAAPAPAAAPTPPPPPAPAPVAPPPAVANRVPAAPVTVGSAVFPSAISPQYQSLTAGKARFKTCDDQYRVNKTNNGNGGLAWIMKGGGYYSQCNKRLKGA